MPIERFEQEKNIHTTIDQQSAELPTGLEERSSLKSLRLPALAVVASLATAVYPALAQERPAERDNGTDQVYQFTQSSAGEKSKKQARCDRQLEKDPLQFNSCQYESVYTPITERFPGWAVKHKLSSPGIEESRDRKLAYFKTHPGEYRRKMAEERKEREAIKQIVPSGVTCSDKIKFYSREGAVFGKVQPSDCSHRPELKNNIVAIEEASRYMGYNPIGGVAVSACESGLTHTATGPGGGARGLFQQMRQYWGGRLLDTQQYINSNAQSKKQVVRLSSDVFDPQSNAFVSIYMLMQGAGPNDWYPSMHCWDSKRSQVAGSENGWRDFKAERPIRPVKYLQNQIRKNIS